MKTNFITASLIGLAGSALLFAGLVQAHETQSPATEQMPMGAMPMNQEQMPMDQEQMPMDQEQMQSMHDAMTPPASGAPITQPEAAPVGDDPHHPDGP